MCDLLSRFLRSHPDPLHHTSLSLLPINPRAFSLIELPWFMSEVNR